MRPSGLTHGPSVPMHRRQELNEALVRYKS